MPEIMKNCARCQRTLTMGGPDWKFVHGEDIALLWAIVRVRDRFRWEITHYCRFCWEDREDRIDW